MSTGDRKIELLMPFGLILSGQPLMGSSSLFYVDNDSQCGSLESQSLRDGYITFSRLMGVRDLVSHLFLDFFISWHDVLLLGSLNPCHQVQTSSTLVTF